MIFINQLRHKIGVTFGSPETTTGGNALKFYASVRLDIRRIGTVKNNGDACGNMTRVRVVKNKMAPPFRNAEFQITYGLGIDRLGELVDLGVEHEIIEKAGSWYAYGDTRLGQGKENAGAFLRENPKTCEEVELAVHAALFGPLSGDVALAKTKEEGVELGSVESK